MILACVKLDTKLAGSDTASEKGFLFFTGPKETQSKGASQLFANLSGLGGDVAFKGC